ncbi:hypothetical protein [Legionella erythra]|uniref:Transmembrane protein n=1 Tax=Legionella erythra TaxID=448 RepID=A0A0W0TUX8_LEGER|nr:hypothetical protein [Legionella erythra]KTC99417.1 hypothetical protein Lery_0318 [Legionella erythra]
MKQKRRYLSWSAIFAGAIAGVGLNFLLNLLSLGLGISSFSIDSEGNTFFSFAGFLCFCLAAVLAMFMTGWIAGKLSPVVVKARAFGLLIGFIAWSMLLIMTIILITNMIQYAAFHSNFTSNLVAIKLTNDAPMLTETVADIKKKSPLHINIETRKKVLTLNALLTFVLFFIGALSSCAGGFLGYTRTPETHALTGHTS